MSDQTPEEIAKALLTKGSFKFMDALKNRSHPEEEVPVYLDEAAAFKLLDVTTRAAQVQHDIVRFGAPVTDVDRERFAKLEESKEAIEAERAAITAELEPSKYIFTVRGVDDGFVEDQLTIARDAYPLEFEEYTNERTGAKVKEDISNPKRDRYYTNLLWRGHIVKIVAPDGSVETAPDIETIAAIRRELPNASRYALAEAIEKVDMAVNWYEALADEVFLAKP